MAPERPQSTTGSDREVLRLVAELEEAELYEQRLRAIIMAVREALTAGRVEQALSMCNEALNEIDSATDVVVPAAGKSK